MQFRETCVKNDVLINAFVKDYRIPWDVIIICYNTTRNVLYFNHTPHILNS